MKRVFLLTGFLFVLVAGNATIRRVGFTDITKPVAGVDYTTLYDAYNAAKSNDTIYVFQGKSLVDGWPVGYSGHIVISKKLFLFSKGYWLDTTAFPKGNAFRQVGPSTADFSRDVEFASGSAGSVISGFNCTGNNLIISTDSIRVLRNFNLTVYMSDLTVKNLIVEGNYRVAFSGNNNVSNIFSNVIIRNNFIYNLELPQKSFNGIIANNTFAKDVTNADAINGGEISMSRGHYGYSGESYINLRSGTWLFQNNLMISYTNATAGNNHNYFAISEGGSSIFNYNVVLQSNNFSIWPGVSTGNIIIPIANYATVFEGFPAIGNRSADDRYILKANSPALQGNRPGSTVDAGMYGGFTPYKISTIPSIPTIYKISSPDGNNPTGTTITILVSTRSNN